MHHSLSLTHHCSGMAYRDQGVNFFRKYFDPSDFQMIPKCTTGYLATRRQSPYCFEGYVEVQKKTQKHTTTNEAIGGV